MLRVIIVDDEPRICQLIIHLIDWEKHGMKMVGIANNGVDALILIEKVDPHIVITDIRMPGYNGLELIEKAKEINEALEFIIISGYEEFSYAQRAIGLEVRDYLCKPIKAESLLKALTRSGEAITSKSRQDDLIEEYGHRDQDTERIRTSFLQDLLIAKKVKLKNSSLTEINQSYYFKFQAGTFQVISVQIDSAREGEVNNTQIIRGLKQHFAKKLREVTYDLESIHQDNTLSIILNYNEKNKSEIEAGISQALNDFKVRLAPYEQMITIGKGLVVTEFAKLTASFEESYKALDDRILKGTGKIITRSNHVADGICQEEFYYDFLKRFTPAVELLDLTAITNALNSLLQKIVRLQQEQNKLSGSALKRLAREIVETYYVTLRKHKLETDHSLAEQKALEASIDNSYSIEIMFQTLLDSFSHSITKLIDRERQKGSQQIRQAKAYIGENYMEKVTLEDLGDHLGLNPSYFSSLFKKETSISFSDYLIQVRIEKAKELLKEADLKVQDISLMVGYNDVRYFRKLFIESTGLKPNEYRKLFS